MSAALESDRYLTRAMALIDRQKRQQLNYWKSYVEDLNRRRLDRFQPEADYQFTNIRKLLEKTLDTHGNRHMDPLFEVTEFTRNIPGDDGPTWLVSAWSVRTPGLPRVTELHLAISRQRLRFDVTGNHLFDDNTDQALRKLHIDDVATASYIIGKIARSFYPDLVVR